MVGFIGRMRDVGICALGVVLAIAVSGTQAGACGYERCFGALALGPNGIMARSSGQRTAPGAHERANVACGEKCDRIEVFHSGCAAMAQAPMGAQDFGFGVDRASAEGEALLLCALQGGEACRVRAWVCSP